jgi:hypothetical protein
MKRYGIVGLCLLIGSVACEPLPDAQARDAKISALEKRVEALENQTASLKSQIQRTSDADETRIQLLRSCIAEADRQYSENWRLNATNATNTSVPVTVANGIMSDRQQTYEKCKMLYGK